MIQVTPHIFLDDDEVRESFIRASGPGGQNVNKVETSVQIRFDVKSSPNLPADVARRLITLAGQKMTKDGILVLTAREHRSQEQNRKAALARLIDLIQKASVRPKYRQKTKPTYASKLRRLEKKQQRGGLKKNRGKINLD